MERIEWITRAFAQSSNVQKSLFPDFVNVADELAVEWDIALEETNSDMLSDNQKLSIKAFDDYLLSISGLENIQYWDDNALYYSNEWNKIRELAKVILDAMGWVDEAPPKCSAIYIRKKIIMIYIPVLLTGTILSVATPQSKCQFPYLIIRRSPIT